MVSLLQQLIWQRNLSLKRGKNRLHRVLSISIYRIQCHSSMYGFWLPLWYLQTFLCSFSFSHCIVCPSSIYSFSSPLWYLLAFINIITFVLYVNIGNFFSVSHPNMIRKLGYGRSVSFLQIHMPELTQHALYDCTNK